MIPSFLKPTEAQKILLIGKSINFLREVCHQVRFLRNPPSLQKTSFFTLSKTQTKATF